MDLMLPNFLFTYLFFASLLLSVFLVKYKQVESEIRLDQL